MEELPKARQVLVLSTGPLASFKFGFWSGIGGLVALGQLLVIGDLVAWAWPLLRTWSGL